jgi:hypothetical protein
VQQGVGAGQARHYEKPWISYRHLVLWQGILSVSHRPAGLPAMQRLQLKVPPLVLWAVFAALALPHEGARATAGERVLGLLTLPDVFGDGACDPFSPGEIALYAEPGDDRKTGVIRVDSHWRFADEGGCEGLQVNVHEKGGGEAQPLPTREHAYEAPAAVVLEARGDWFRIRTPAGASWLRATPRDVFLPIATLLRDTLAYITADGSGALFDAPAGAPQEQVGEHQSIHVVSFADHGDRLWVEVGLLSHSPCESGDAPQVVALGWLPAHTASGEPSVWFYSRGC